MKRLGVELRIALVLVAASLISSLLALESRTLSKLKQQTGDSNPRRSRSLPSGVVSLESYAHLRKSSPTSKKCDEKASI
jgi:hypothetical protein